MNFVLVAHPLSLGPMSLGLVYFVFLPAVVTTLFAGRVALMRSACGRRSGARSRWQESDCHCC